MDHRPPYDKAGRRAAAKRDRAETDYRRRQDRWWADDVLTLDDPDGEPPEAAAEALHIAQAA